MYPAGICLVSELNILAYYYCDVLLFALIPPRTPCSFPGYFILVSLTNTCNPLSLALAPLVNYV